MTPTDASEITLRSAAHLSDVVAWNLRGGVRQADAVAIADELGLGDAFRFPRINANNVYRRAVRLAVVGGANDRRSFFVKEVEDSASFIVHEFVSVDVVDSKVADMTDKSAAFRHEVMVRFDKLAYGAGRRAEELLESEDPTHPLAAKVIATYLAGTVEAQFTTSDIRIGFQRAFESWGGMPLVEMGGSWLIPAPYAAKTRAWRTFMERIGSRGRVIPIHDSTEGAEELARMSEDSLENQLSVLLEELGAFSGRDNVRLSTLEARVDRFDELRATTELYERLLGNKLDDLRGRLEAAQGALVAALRDMKE